MAVNTVKPIYTILIHFTFQAVVIFFSCTGIRAQELFFTYVGIMVQGGTNTIQYESWFDDKQSSLTSRGMSLGGGAFAVIFVNQFAGQFSLTYMTHSSDSTPDVSVSYPLATVTGKYYYPLHRSFQPGIGAGFYLDLPPASADYNGGAGGVISLCSLIVLSNEISMLMDIYLQYGSFGIGESSTKIESGISLGVAYKAGRL